MNWAQWTSDDFGNFKLETLQCAATMQSARELRRLNHTMERIEQLLLGLGRDGLHTVIREQRRLANERTAARREERKRLKTR